VQVARGACRKGLLRQYRGGLGGFRGQLPHNNIQFWSAPREGLEALVLPKPSVQFKGGRATLGKTACKLATWH